jgi:hypothetical protein
VPANAWVDAHEDVQSRSLSPAPFELRVLQTALDFVVTRANFYLKFNALRRKDMLHKTGWAGQLRFTRTMSRSFLPNANLLIVLTLVIITIQSPASLVQSGFHGNSAGNGDRCDRRHHCWRQGGGC